MATYTVPKNIKIDEANTYLMNKRWKPILIHYFTYSEKLRFNCAFLASFENQTVNFSKGGEYNTRIFNKNYINNAL